MHRYDTSEFGEAGPFLRKTDLELMAAQNIAFDGNHCFVAFKVHILHAPVCQTAWFVHHL